MGSMASTIMLELLTSFLLLSILCPALSSPITENNITTGIVISGGSQGLNKWVELFIPSSGDSCLFPSVPDIRENHSMNKMFICGGDDFYARDLCIQFVDGQWKTLSATLESRDDHSGWLTPEGLLLMGGSYNGGKSTEVIPIEGGEGGYSMVRIRNNHGCGAYTDSQGAQVLIAAGGWDHVEFEYLDSTEILVSGSGDWSLTTPLPTVMYAMKTATVDNKVFMTGGRLRYMETDTKNIWEWEGEEKKWEKVGEMKTARSSHAVSSIQLTQDLLQYCI